MDRIRSRWAPEREKAIRDAAFVRRLKTATDEELRQIASNYSHKNAPEWKVIAINRESLRRVRENADTIPVPPMYKTYRCISCGGAAHPATGCVYSETAISCWRCTKEFWAWAVAHTNKKARRRRKSGQPQPDVSFYEAAGKWRNDLP